MTSHSISDGVAEKAVAASPEKAKPSIESVERIAISTFMYITCPSFLFKVN
jgi:hypothetical protein